MKSKPPEEILNDVKQILNDGLALPKVTQAHRDLDDALKDPLWAHVKKLQEENEYLSFELSTIRATLLVNYGENGRQLSLLTGTEFTVLAMLIKVLEHYTKPLDPITPSADCECPNCL